MPLQSLSVPSQTSNEAKHRHAVLGCPVEAPHVHPATQSIVLLHGAEQTLLGKVGATRVSPPSPGSSPNGPGAHTPVRFKNGTQVSAPGQAITFVVVHNWSAHGPGLHAPATDPPAFTFRQHEPSHIDSNVQPAALPTGMQMPPEHSESLAQGSPAALSARPDSKPRASLPEPDSPPSVAPDVPLSAPRIEEGGPESIRAPPSLMTGLEPEQAAVPPKSNGAMMFRSARRRACLMVDLPHDSAPIASGFVRATGREAHGHCGGGPLGRRLVS
jgi:hypothetical protein